MGGIDRPSDNTQPGGIAQPGHVARSGGTAIVDVRGLTKRYGRVEALRDVTFTVPAGSVTGFLGANGSGKTTTLRILLGLVAPTGGSALIHGRAYRELSYPAGTVGAVLEPTAHPARSGRDHLRCLAVGSTAR